MSRPNSAERWRGLLRQQAGSGLSVAEFCRRQGVSPPSFYQWRKRLRAESAGAEVASAGSFLPLSVLGAGAVTAVEIELPCGAVVRVPQSEEQALKRVLSLLLAAEAARP